MNKDDQIVVVPGHDDQLGGRGEAGSLYTRVASMDKYGRDILF